MIRKIVSFNLIVLMICSGCASTPKPKPAISAAISEEIAIGQKIHSEILNSFRPYTDPKVVDYVTGIGRSLAEHAERKELPYRFTILYNEKIYATSSPGGNVYLTTGLLDFLRNEAELAAVMAHEIAELQYHDPRLSKNRKILEAVTKTGAAVGPAFGSIGTLAVLGLVLLNAAAESGQMTPEERLLQADGLALHYMVEAGYDPQGMIDVFWGFLKADRRIVPYFSDYYQSRPITEDRVFNVNREFQKLPLEGKSFSVRRETYEQMIKGVHQIYQP